MFRTNKAAQNVLKNINIQKYSIDLLNCEYDKNVKIFNFSYA